jgi:hypothetical protein
MTMRITCPNCQEIYPIDAAFADDDGKRLAALCAEMEPALGRAALAYLRYFKPPKTALRTSRAVKIVQELLDLVRTGTVCRDERGGLHRRATPMLWAAGIEQMLAVPGKIQIPLSNHHYLRAVVFGLADEASAVDERAREKNLRQGKRPEEPALAPPAERLAGRLAYLRKQLDYRMLSQDAYDAEVAKANAEYAPS